MRETRNTPDRRSRIKAIPWNLGLALLAAAFAAGCASTEVGLRSSPTASDAAEPGRGNFTQAAGSLAKSTSPPAISAFRGVVDESARRIAAGEPPDSANYVGLIEDGHEALLLRAHLMRSARRSIDIQTFIWTDDECGRLLMRELMQAAGRGVRVRVLVDSFGAEKDSEILAHLTTYHPNLQIRVYRPARNRLEIGFWPMIPESLLHFKSVNQRMHNKLMVVDGEVALTGGRNFEDTYYNHSTSMNFKDRDAVVVGPVAQSMQRSFDEYWEYHHSIPGEQLTDVAKATRRMEDNGRPTFAPPPPFSAAVARQADDAESIRRMIVPDIRPVRRAEYIVDKPGKNGALHLTGSGAKTERIINAVGRAERSITIQSPYLVLSRRGKRVFSRLHRENPDLVVRISTNSLGSTDNILAYSGNLRSRETLVDRLGFEVYEYRPDAENLRTVLPNYDDLVRRHRSEQRAMPPNTAAKRSPFVCIHAKSMVVDGRVAYVGTFNLDPRSANLNTEGGLIFEDEVLAAELEKSILEDMLPTNSYVIANRAHPPGVAEIAELTEDIIGLSPVDLWPLRTIGAFELKPGKPGVPRDHPDFYENYRDVGSCPGAEHAGSHRKLVTELLRSMLKSANPLL